MALSDLLNRVKIHALRDQKFRNPDGVYMKLCNFLRFDDAYHGTGLSRGGKLEEVIWDEFNADRDRLRRLGQAIRSSIEAEEISGALVNEDEEGALALAPNP